MSPLPYCLSLVETMRTREGRVASKILASSLLRNLPMGDVHVTRKAPEQPLFRVGREGLIEEWLEDAKGAEHPWSRPWREGASAAVWAVRGAHYAAVMAEWQRLAGTRPPREGGNRIEGAWNRLLVDTPLKVARFERGEIAFSTLPGARYEEWNEAAILHVGEWSPKVRARFLQAQFFGTYFGDASGLFLDLMEP